MFPLSQTISRTLCRILFVCGCVGPLVALALWGGYRHTSLHTREQEFAFRRSLGLQTNVSSVAHPRPGITRYTDVTLCDPETGQTVAACELVELRRAALQGPTRLAVAGLTVPKGSLAACYALLERLIQHISNDELNLVLSIEGITIADGDSSTSIARASGTLRVGRSDSEARLVFETATPTPADTAAASTGDRIQLRVARHHETTQPRDEWELHTGQLALPCSWLSAILGQAPSLEQGHFHGSIWAKDAASGGTLTVRGGLTGVNLATLAAQHFGQVLEGHVDVELIEPAHLQGGRLLDLHARIVGGPGRISRALLTSAVSSLGCVPAQGQREPDGVLNFEQMALQVAIDAHGRMVIAGRCSQARGALLSAADGRSLLGEPRQQPQSVVNLVRALGGSDLPTIPATPQAAQLLSWLPPNSTAVSSAESTPATAARSPAPQPDSGQRRQR